MPSGGRAEIDNVTDCTNFYVLGDGRSLDKTLPPGVLTSDKLAENELFSPIFGKVHTDGWTDGQTESGPYEPICATGTGGLKNEQGAEKKNEKATRMGKSGLQITGG